MNYTFGSPGNYTVRLRTGFNTLCATKTKIITVTDIAGPINGLSEVCANQQNVAYSIPAVTGASYDWWVSGGTATISGDGTNSVGIDFGQNFTEVHVGVQVNDCYKQSVLTLSVAPNCGGGSDSCYTQSAFGHSQACINQTTNFWNLSTGTHDTYSWKINGTEVSTANNLQYTFTDTSTYVIELGVGTGGNICSNSSQIIMLPETAGPIIGDSFVCRGQNYTFSVDPNPNASYNWWLNGDGSVISGQGTNQATIHIGNSFNTSDVRVGVNFESCYKESNKVLTAQNCGARMAAANTELLNIIPHPFSEQTTVAVETGTPILNVKIYTVNGKEIFNSGKVSQEIVTIGETLAAGYYIIHVVTETDTYIKMLIKF